MAVPKIDILTNLRTKLSDALLPAYFRKENAVEKTAKDFQAKISSLESNLEIRQPVVSRYDGFTPAFARFARVAGYEVREARMNYTTFGNLAEAALCTLFNNPELSLDERIKVGVALKVRSEDYIAEMHSTIIEGKNVDISGGEKISSRIEADGKHTIEQIKARLPKIEIALALEDLKKKFSMYAPEEPVYVNYNLRFLSKGLLGYPKDDAYLLSVAGVSGESLSSGKYQDKLFSSPVKEAEVHSFIASYFGPLSQAVLPFQ